jgi:hypothetical protein
MSELPIGYYAGTLIGAAVILYGFYWVINRFYQKYKKQKHPETNNGDKENE